MLPGSSTTLDTSLSFVEGDTWGGIPSLTIRVDGTAPSDDLASVKMQFRTAPTSAETLAQLSSAGGSITITSASDWEIEVPAQELLLYANRTPYFWALQTTDINGIVQTYLQGTIQVLPKLIY